MMSDRKPGEVVDAAKQRMLRAALAYAERFRLFVFPLYEVVGDPPTCTCKSGPACTSPGKHPRVRAGWRQATIEPDHIREWWTKWPNANIGVALGPSLVVVVDVDPRTSGEESLAGLQRQHGPLPDTAVAITGSGGRHYLFHRPRGPERVRGKPLGRGVDVKADDAYIVASPSAHVSGKAYSWLPTAHVRDTPFAPLPDWILQKLDTSGRAGKVEGGAPTEALLGLAFQLAGWLGRPLGPGKAAARCPWEDEHEVVTQRFDGSTVVFGSTESRQMGWFFCAAVACRNRTVNDVLARVPDEAKRAAREKLGMDPAFIPEEQPTPIRPGDEEWERGLAFNDKGILTKDVGNAALLLYHLPEWRGVLGYNAFAGRVEFVRPGPPLAGFNVSRPGMMEDDQIVYVNHWLRKRRGVSFDDGLIMRAIEQAARRNPFHPVKDYLEAAQWDGVPRLDRWLHLYVGAEDNDYARAVGRWWMISAVARAYRPGCQADHMLILQGPHGSGKSSATRILAGEWHLGSMPNVHDREAADKLYGYWIVEVGELDAFRGASLQRVKDFVTQVSDVYRGAYARYKRKRERSCVFVGTTNESHYLRDPTGARRFWPITVGKLRREELLRDRDALWAEAVTCYQDGAEWWPSEDLRGAIEHQQEDRYDVDPWEDLIGDWVAGKSTVVMRDVLLAALKLEPRDQTQASQQRAGAILRRIGFESRIMRTGNRVTREWVKEG